MTMREPGQTTSSAPIVRVHRRQYVVGPRPFGADPGWRHFDLGSSLVLSIDPELRCVVATDRDGTTWHLLGAAVDSRADRSGPQEELACAKTDDIRTVYEGWSGRWILVGAGALHPDATALLACYYGRAENGEAWASSSPALIRRLIEPEGSPHPPGGWRPSPDATIRRISWYPPPHSGMPGVNRLLPSQILNLREASAQPRPLVRALPSNPGDESLVEELGRSLRTVITRFAALNAPHELTLLLSGGRDSRILLSMAAAARVPATTFTRIHRRASLADRLLPPRLARTAGYPHREHRQRRELPGRRQVILDHAGYNVAWLSAEEFVRGGSDPLTGIALAGFCAELGRDRLIPDVPVHKMTGRLLARHFHEDDPALIAALDAWLAWRKAHPDPMLDLADHFFLEQRTAGRKGAKEQICDLFRVERVPPLNSTRLLGLIAHLSLEARREASWIPQLVRSGLPALLAEPMNPLDADFGLIRGRLLNPAAYRRTLSNLLHRFGRRTAL